MVDKVVSFLVVNLPSAYNAIIGRPTLNALRVVTSTFHLKLKFPTSNEVGEIYGDQQAARNCYVASMKGKPDAKATMTVTRTT